MSDGFDVRIMSVTGAEVVIDVLTSTIGEYDDLCASRSFALVVLRDALHRARDRTIHIPRNDPLRRAEWSRLDDKHTNAALTRALANEPDGWYVDEAWMRANVSRFVKECILVERRNNVGADELARRERQILEEHGGELLIDQTHEWQPKRWERCHNYTLRVIVTDPKWADHLEPGLEFGTTAFDVWYED